MSHLVVAAAALAVWLGVGGSAAEPGRKAYLTHVSTVCQTYARRLSASRLRPSRPPTAT
jgi:hypothetical protein